MAEKLFAEFPPVSTEEWEKVITTDLKGADYEKKLVWKTMDGFSVRPYYRAEDLKNLKHLRVAPGCFPFVRGTKDNNKWLTRQDYCACDGNYDRANAGLKKGVNAVGFCRDGKKPVSVKEMQTMLKGIDLSKTEVNFVGCCCATAEIIKSFIAVVKEQKVNADNVKASFDFDPIRVLNQKGAFCDD